ncbi:hypothetical protein AVEN_122434-1 [Araneus ventricosus]|uniref:Uncharacterized protein n=1 Tax=Araneus ventricosus TaxID=182803 RepID=A0A4Y2FK00_ARAVE|nr:hypothetical protein AVEN_122434-1 [Araneus ventricosus]
MNESPLFETDESFVDDVFEEGDFPMVLRYGYSPGYGPYRDLVLDRGYYPAQLKAGAEDFEPMLFESPERSPPRWGEIAWRRASTPEIYVPSIDNPYPSPYYEGAHVWPKYGKLPSAQKTYGAKTATPSPRPPPRAAAGTVKISPHTPAISQFSRFGYTDPRAKILNIPPGDDLDVPSGIKKTVTIASPGREKPLHLNVQVAPKSISQSPSGEHIICDIAVGVEEAVIKPRKVAGYFTPPATETVRRYDRKHGMFTPRSVFKKGHYAIRNIFDVSPHTPSPRPPPLDTTIEWEHDYLNRLYGAGPSGAGLNTTFTRSPSPGLNRTFDVGPASPPGAYALNRTFDSSSGYEADGYHTPSYQEPEYPVWTYPMRRKRIAASPAQDLITAVEDVGFDYYSTPSSPSPRRYYPETY